VRRRRDHADAVGGGAASELEAFLDRRRPVVDAGEDVRVEVDHGVFGNRTE
jgi:hypothetical protein